MPEVKSPPKPPPPRPSSPPSNRTVTPTTNPQGRLFGLPKWVVVVIGILGVILAYYIYKHSQNSSSVSSSTGGVDENQLASDIAAQLAATLGGTPNSTDLNATSPTDNSSLLAELAQQQAESLQLLQQLVNTGSGVGGTTSPTGGGTVPTDFTTIPTTNPLGISIVNPSSLTPQVYQGGTNITGIAGVIGGSPANGGAAVPGGRQAGATAVAM